MFDVHVKGAPRRPSRGVAHRRQAAVAERRGLEVELLAALEEFESAAVDDGRPLAGSDYEYYKMQALEWALAEGVTEIDGREVRLRDLVLEAGIVLEADQRLWLERATEEPLKLWKIVGVSPGEGLELQDLLDEGAETVWTAERSGSRRLRRTEVIAARLARWNGGWEIAALYSIPDHEVLRLVSHLEDEVGAGGADPRRARRVGRLIRDYWVRLFTRRQPIPDIVDSGGDPIELTTDHWQVMDEVELKRRLAAEPDVVGTRERGWSRLQDPGAETSRTLLALNPGKRPDRLEVFARTRKLADEGRRWLEGVAGRAWPKTTAGIRSIWGSCGRRSVWRGEATAGISCKTRNHRALQGARKAPAAGASDHQKPSTARRCRRRWPPRTPTSSAVGWSAPGTALGRQSGVYRASPGGGAVSGAPRRNRNRSSGFAPAARRRRNSPAVSRVPTFSATAAAMN